MSRLFPSTWLRPAAMSTDFDRLIQDFWRAGSAPLGLSAIATGVPSMNVHETSETFEVELELPGMKLEDLEVVLEGRDLAVRGERKLAAPEGASWHRRERFHGKFSRAIRLPMDVDSSRVSASLQHGVLSVTCPKSEAAKARRIPIQANHVAPSVQ